MKYTQLILDRMNTVFIIICRFVIINLLMSITSIPFIFHILFIPMDQTSLFITTCLASLLIPSISAGFYTIMKFLIKKESDNLFSSYFHAYTSNFKQAFTLGILVIILSLFFQMNLRILQQQAPLHYLILPTYLVILVLVIILLEATMFLGLFHTTIVAALFNAITWIFISPKSFLKITALLICFSVLCLFLKSPYLTLFYFVIPCYLILACNQETNLKGTETNVKNSPSR